MHDNQSPHFHGTDCRHKRKSEISLFSVKPSTINMGPNSQIKFFSLQLVPNASEIKRSSQSWVLVVIKKVDYGVHKTRFWKFLKINGLSNIIDPTSTNMGWYIKTRPEPLDIVYGKTILSFNEKNYHSLLIPRPCHEGVCGNFFLRLQWDFILVAEAFILWYALPQLDSEERTDQIAVSNFTRSTRR